MGTLGGDTDRESSSSSRFSFRCVLGELGVDLAEAGYGFGMGGGDVMLFAVVGLEIEERRGRGRNPGREARVVARLIRVVERRSIMMAGE